MSSADTRTRAIEALDRACSLPPAAGMDGEQVGGGRVLLTYEEAVDALIVAGWRPPADDAAEAIVRDAMTLSAADVDVTTAEGRAAARATAARAIDVATRAEGEWRFGVNNDRRNLREAIVDALVAAGLIRPAHDDAAYVAMREEFIRIIDDADSCIHAQPSKESLATTLVRAARAALAAADQEEKP